LKVHFTNLVNYMAGRSDNTVLYGAFNRQFSISRAYTYPTLTADNHIKGSIMKNLASVWHNSAPAYVTDLKTYTTRYFTENLSDPGFVSPPRSAFAFFIKMMFAWMASDPEHVDLTTVTVADVVSMDADVKTITRAVSAEFLPAIETSDDLTHPIQA
jgi:hypothetical protein